MPYSSQELILYGNCDIISTDDSYYGRTVGFFKINALTGDTISFFYLDLAAQLSPDTLYRFDTEFTYGNMALTKDNDFVFCGLVNTVNAGIVDGNPFIGSCDMDGHLKWFRRILKRDLYSKVKLLPLADGNSILLFADRSNFKFWIYLFDADGNLLSKRDVQNPSVFDFPYRFSDALLTEQGDLIIIGNTSVQYPNNSYGMGDPFIAKVANIGIPYRNPWEGHMTDVAALYEQPFILFPNPTSGATTIKTGRDGTLTVYTTLGQVVWSGEVRHFEQQIDFSGLASGLYLYDFYTKNASRKVFGKFIKQ